MEEKRGITGNGKRVYENREQRGNRREKGEVGECVKKKMKAQKGEAGILESGSGLAR